MEVPDRAHRRVVVVGGGIAGAILANHMQFDSDVVLIDQKEYFEIPWARSRSMVEPSFAERSVIKHTDYLSNGRLSTSPAIDVTETEILTEEGRAFAYDYLVIASGHDRSPIARSRVDRLKHFEKDCDKIRASSSVLIIGGGRTGVELAGEIAVDFKGKKITLVHKGPRLLQVLGPKASERTLKWLTSRGVEVLLDQSIDLDDLEEGETEFATSAGRILAADCHFVCVGKPPGSSWFDDSTVLKDCVDRHGRVIVDDNLRIRGKKNIFAIGDITDVRESKQGFAASNQAAVVAKNLKLMMGGGEERKLAIYRPSSSSSSGTVIVSLGRRQAVAQSRITTAIGYLPGLFKSKDLYVGWIRKQLGLQPDHLIT